MKMKWKIIIFSLLLVMALGYGFYEMNRPKEIDITEAYKGTGELYFIETGYVASQEDMTIYPLATGKIEHLYVEENQYVNKGDTLLEIDTKPYEFELLKLETDLTGIDAQIENLYTEENKSKTDLKARRDSLQGELSALSAKIDDNT
ncbi:MAG: biotin/lipoyl-binding protein, partial [Lachnospiraceae bacterium]|nr:biotin/lipoyl-binding protein [Lachnospiraceae bacterium]